MYRYKLCRFTHGRSCLQVATSVPESDSVSASIRYRTWPIGAIGCCASAQDNESAGFTGRRVSMHGLHGRFQRRDRELAALRREEIVSCLDDI